MSKRNIWTEEEVKCFLNIMKEKQVLKLLNGKKYMKKNVYKMVETEMRACGFENKNTEQIILKWRKLKSECNKVKRENEISERSITHCPFEDELNELLEARPGASFEGIDVSAGDYKLKESDDPLYLDTITSESLNEEDDESTNNGHHSTRTVTEKNHCKKRTPYATSMNHCTKEFLAVQHKLQNDFFVKQKALLEYEHQLQQQHEKQILKAILHETASLLENSRNFYLSHKNCVTKRGRIAITAAKKNQCKRRKKRVD